MANDPNAIRLGASRIFYGGVDFGFTHDGTTVEIKTTTKRMDVDHFGVVETIEVVLRREASIKFNAVETTVANLKLLFGGTSLRTTTATQDYLSLPVSAGFSMPQTANLLRLHPVDRALSDVTEDIVFPKAIWSGNTQFTAKVDEIRMFSVEFVAYRDEGDYLFRFGA